MWVFSTSVLRHTAPPCQTRLNRAAAIFKITMCTRFICKCCWTQMFQMRRKNTSCSNAVVAPAVFLAAARDGAPASAPRLHKDADAVKFIHWRPPLVKHEKRQFDCELRRCTENSRNMKIIEIRFSLFPTQWCKL